jgi:hypothetical protein
MYVWNRGRLASVVMSAVCLLLLSPRARAIQPLDPSALQTIRGGDTVPLWGYHCVGKTGCGWTTNCYPCEIYRPGDPESPYIGYCKGVDDFHELEWNGCEQWMSAVCYVIQGPAYCAYEQFFYDQNCANGEDDPIGPPRYVTACQP